MLKQQKLKAVHNFKIFQSIAYLPVLRTKEILIPDIDYSLRKCLLHLFKISKMTC